MPLPLGYFLSWSGYGTRLHGDERGSVDAGHNRLGTPPLAPDAARNDHAADLMTDPPFTLCPRGRTIVDATIRDHCRIRGWDLFAANPRKTHVHVVLNCHGKASPELAMAQLKSWCTRRLVEAGLARKGQKLWTDHGSTRWLNHDEGLRLAIDYAERLQDEPAKFEREKKEKEARERFLQHVADVAARQEKDAG